MLISLRGIEGVGILLALMPAPALLRTLTPYNSQKFIFGLWSAYMPTGTALAMLLGPIFTMWLGWRGWWGLAAAFSAISALAVMMYLPADATRAKTVSNISQILHSWLSGLRLTLSASAPRLLGLSFAVYSAQWMAVIGFLPAIYVQAGLSIGQVSILTAIVPAVNIIGNISAGFLLQRGVQPPNLLRIGFSMMALSAIAAFAPLPYAGNDMVLRYIAVCMFSMCGGMVPATLFMLSARLSPTPTLVSTTIGLVTQASVLGQFLAPPAVAWLHIKWVAGNGHGQ
jgi:cyanate permease